MSSSSVNIYPGLHGQYMLLVDTANGLYAAPSRFITKVYKKKGIYASLPGKSYNLTLI